MEEGGRLETKDDADVTVGEAVAGGGGTDSECDGRIVISEIAWAGTAANSDDEWIELRNIGGEPVDVTGWVLRWRMKQPMNPEDFEWKTMMKATCCLNVGAILRLAISTPTSSTTRSPRT